MEAEKTVASRRVGEAEQVGVGKESASGEALLLNKEPAVATEEEKVVEKDVAKAEALQSSLRTSLDGVEITTVISMLPGKSPEVSFVGAWNGRLIHAAQNALAKAYRLRRYAKLGKV